MPTINVAFWNLQNLFDTNLSPIASDLGFTPENGWTDEAKLKKIENLADIINGMFNDTGPDLLGICEIENIEIINELKSKLNRTDLEVAHINSPDIRGIDCSLIYSKDLFEEIGNPIGHLVHLRYPTRDIFEVKLKVKSNNSELVVLVNHWPSRYRGLFETEPYRITVASQCGKIVDKHLKISRSDFLNLGDTQESIDLVNKTWNNNIILLGDFNDEPYNRSILSELQASSGFDKIEELIKKGKDKNFLPQAENYFKKKAYLFNCSWNKLNRPDTGTHYFSQSVNTMNMLDQIIISRGLLFGENGLKISYVNDLPRFDIYTPEKLRTSNKNVRPKKFQVKKNNDNSFSIKGGYSDHFPIYTSIETI